MIWRIRIDNLKNMTAGINCPGMWWDANINQKSIKKSLMISFASFLTRTPFWMCVFWFKIRTKLIHYSGMHFSNGFCPVRMSKPFSSRQLKSSDCWVHEATPRKMNKFKRTHMHICSRTAFFYHWWWKRWRIKCLNELIQQEYCRVMCTIICIPSVALFFLDLH